MRDADRFVKEAEAALRGKECALDGGVLRAFVKTYFDRREEFLGASGEAGEAAYVIDPGAIRGRVSRFREAFGRHLADFRVFYAVKTNNHPEVARIMSSTGIGLDVSSGLELEMAVGAGESDIVFSGPAKSDEELRLAIRHRERVTVLIDSFRELGRLEALCEETGTEMRAGVRLTTDERGLWRKFGIPLGQLKVFLEESERCRRVKVRGLQFHTSWNMDAEKQVRFIERLGGVLAELGRELCRRLEFLDIGGGYWPERGEWLQHGATTAGIIQGALDSTPAPTTTEHYFNGASEIEEFAEQISGALKRWVFPHVQVHVCAEPGRWVVNDGMHLLLRVAEKKAGDLVITDAATNTVGWERFESDYFPILNLTRPGMEEKECYVLGSLCTPHDVWGYAYFGTGIEEGDVLMIPTQGAYTYSLRQHFIKPLPRTVVLCG